MERPYPSNSEIGAKNVVDFIAAIKADLAGFALDADVLHKAGAETVAGSKTFASDIVLASPSLKRSVNTARLNLCGGNGAARENGARFVACGAEDGSEPGTFYAVAQNAGATINLKGTAAGNLTWGGQPLQTSSDERLKTDFCLVPPAVLDAWEAVGWQRFRYRAAKEAKGEAARWHAGLVAQRVKEVFEERGLDACAHGILCHEAWEDEWAEDEDGSRILVRPAGEMWTIRYEEALALEAICQRRRAARLEARIAALEKILTSILERDA